MLRSIYSGISGLRAHQTRIDVIGNNIANVNTTAFKASRVRFSEQVSQLEIGATAPGSTSDSRGGVNPRQVGLGVQTAAIDTILSQGAMQSTGKVTDIAIQGDGYFIVNDGQARYYSRAGSYEFDGEGNLVNSANGFKVMGWMAQKKTDEAGLPYYEVNHSDSLQTLQVPAGAVIPPRATTELLIRGNLDSRITTTPPEDANDAVNYAQTTAEVFDTMGNKHEVVFRFTRSEGEAGVWSWQIEDTDDDNMEVEYEDQQTLNFDDNGLLVDSSPDTAPGQYEAGKVTISWTLPSGEITSTTITPNFGNEESTKGLTQFSSNSTAVVADQNGFGRGELTGIAIDKLGTISGVFSNGRQQIIGQMALATFTNPAGLQKLGEGNFIQTNNSGDPVIRIPGQGEAGSLNSGSLEMSNVDLGQQFTDMIITQRGFSANSKVITTSDEVLQELLGLKR